MSISKRLLLLMIVAIGALVIVAGQSMIQMHRVYQAANFGNENVVPSILQLNLAQRNFMQIRIRVYRLVLNTDPKAVAEIEKLLEEGKVSFIKALDAYEKLLAGDEDRQFLELERRQFGEYSSKLPRLLTKQKSQI